MATREVFQEAGAAFHPRFELRNYQPALKLVEDGLCYTICDPMTASSYFDYQASSPRLVFRPFAPSVYLSVSILEPAHRPASLLGEAFGRLLKKALQDINGQFE